MNTSHGDCSFGKMEKDSRSDVHVQVSLAHISKADWVDGEKGCQGKFLANAGRGKPTIWFPRESMWGFGKGDLEVWAVLFSLKSCPNQLGSKRPPTKASRLSLFQGILLFYEATMS